MKYLNYGFRTDNGAVPAACTFRVVGLGREETVFIGFGGYNDTALWAHHNTKTAAFASFDINNNFACHQDNYA
jgi:hypothetical protein